MHVKFYVDLKKIASEMLEMIQKVFGNEALSRTQVFECYLHFKASRTLVEDNEHLQKFSI